ncbi:MAG: queuosine precursor transporter [Deltaproteobacteria bacterium]|nr:queuosine precursor transporter [Deltaproteobacteria bacterium]
MNPFKGVPGEERYSGCFVIIVSVFVTCLITANVTAVKLIQVFGFILPAAIFIFPLSYITGDVLAEVYGYRQTRKVIWLGFCCNFIVVAFIWIGQIMPPAVFWDGQAAYERILGYTRRLLGASFMAYLVGEFANAYVLAKMKIATQGRWLWLRTIGSTVVGQGLDSAIFIVFAFAGTIPLRGLAAAAVTQWLAKTIYEAALTPVTYMVVKFLKRKEGVDVYDHETQFNPFSFSK